ncbi:MAG: carbon-nitrogen hydrolase family protein [Bacillota bacterium]|nr:carbon-nitrogen hydrolase family protein [Bacillota bacterium]
MTRIRALIADNWKSGKELAQLGKDALEQGAGLEKLVVLPPMTDFHKTSGIIKASELGKVLEEWCSFARKLQVYLIPGTMLVNDEAGAGILHQAPLIDKYGQIIGVSSQTHLSSQEVSWGWQASNQLPLMDTPFGKLAILLNSDCWQPEVWRLITLLGAKMAVAYTMVEAPYTESYQLAGSWQNVQQNQVFAIECSLTGQWEGREYQGRSAIIGPCELTSDFSGFLPCRKEGDWLEVEISLEELEQVRQQYPLLKQLNLPLYENKLLPLYRQATTGADNK